MTKFEFKAFKFIDDWNWALSSIAEHDRADVANYAALAVIVFAGFLSALSGPASGVFAIGNVIYWAMVSVGFYFGMKGVALLGLLAMKPLHARLERKWVRSHV